MLTTVYTGRRCTLITPVRSDPASCVRSGHAVTESPVDFSQHGNGSPAVTSTERFVGFPISASALASSCRQHVRCFCLFVVAWPVHAAGTRRLCVHFVGSRGYCCFKRPSHAGAYVFRRALFIVVLRSSACLARIARST